MATSDDDDGSCFELHVAETSEDSTFTID
eukprot:SAG11_NODE_27234_length_335_cov_0.656780_1_plen_28_part_10